MKNKMKRRLRIRFVLLSMAALLLLQGAVIFFSAYYSYKDMAKKADLIINQIRENPDISVGYFSVVVNPGKSVIKVEKRQNVPIRQEDAVRLTKAVLASDETSGFTEDYRYQVYKKDGAIRILFLSRTASIEMYKSSTRALTLISLAGLAVMCVILILLSGWIVSPIVNNHQKQKRFITSASHELKTPLAVILADVQLLETEVGDNPWIDDIEAQILRLTKMTESLVALSHSEEQGVSVKRSPFSVTALALDVIGSYEGLSRTSRKEIKCDITPNVICAGDEGAVRQLLSILLDNAFKYCPENGEISVSLQKKHREVLLTVTNTAENISEEQISSFTDRFYRGKNAEQTKGFGLGLSIAKAIVENHKGTLTVISQDKNRISITATLR